MSARGVVVACTFVAAGATAAVAWLFWPVAGPSEPQQLLRRFEPEPIPTPLSDRYRGDKGRFSGKLKSLSALKLPAREALLVLANAEVFTSSTVGNPPALSTNGEAFRMLLADPHADDAFKELVAYAGLPGQLYGLAGTYFTDRAFFQAAVERYRHAENSVPSLDGCIGGRREVSEIVKHMDSGWLPRQLRSNSEDFQHFPKAVRKARA